MNKKGQSLLIFIIMLPLVLIFFAYIIDVGVMYNAKIKGKNLLKYALEEEIDIKDYFKINDIEIETIRKDYENSQECVIISYKIDSIFGNLVGYSEYSVEINSCE